MRNNTVRWILLFLFCYSSCSALLFCLIILTLFFYFWAYGFALESLNVKNYYNYSISVLILMLSLSHSFNYKYAWCIGWESIWIWWGIILTYIIISVMFHIPHWLHCQKSILVKFYQSILSLTYSRCGCVSYAKKT